ncbi:ABC transporter ATP-binding protein [Bordetella genomosp. 13]|uniref:ABC transporter ATP-binding protein n=1 Tax=Bordetella genomosp. 13 TaxID=463040 RepID=UPI0011AA55CC|nr:ATP-binding cassette domain-containing protein [Bordetella genomosp. 13]
MSSPILSLRGLCKRFGGVVVADRIDLDIGPGEILGLIGPNGAGKTSLFNLVSGVVAADAGTIALSGTPLAGQPLHRRARAGVARTWQHMRLFGSLSVMENLMVAPTEYPGESIWRLVTAGPAVRRAEQRSRERARQVLARMKLDKLADANVNDITFGQQKLVGLARALMSEGPCLLLDEPMAGVEGAAYETMRDIVREEAQAGRAVCVVEHNVSFIQDLCNSAVFMAQGRILERGDVATLLRSKTLAELYFGK